MLRPQWMNLNCNPTARGSALFPLVTKQEKRGDAVHCKSTACMATAELPRAAVTIPHAPRPSIAPGSPNCRISYSSRRLGGYGVEAAQNTASAAKWCQNPPTFAVNWCYCKCTHWDPSTEREWLIRVTSLEEVPGWLTADPMMTHTPFRHEEPTPHSSTAQLLCRSSAWVGAGPYGHQGHQSCGTQTVSGETLLCSVPPMNCRRWRGILVRNHMAEVKYFQRPKEKKSLIAMIKNRFV